MTPRAPSTVIRNRVVGSILLTCVVVAGCGGTPGEPDPGDGTGLFVQGCPYRTRATALHITHPDLRMDGPDAIGGQGDYLLMNNRAAYIIQAPDNIRSFYYYGGIPIDAVAVRDCQQAGPERFTEVGFLLAVPYFSQFEDSIIRAFKGETVEIVNDGSDGQDAWIRVTGTDDFLWELETRLLKDAFINGSPKPLSEPFGLEVVMDYFLAPSSPVLRMEMTLRNVSEDPVALVLAATVMFADTTRAHFYAHDSANIGDLEINIGLPWIAATHPEGSWAFAFSESNMATVNMAGIDALADFDQLFDSIYLEPAGGNDSATLTFFFTVGGGGLNTAVRHLQAVNPSPIPRESYVLRSFSGRVTAAESGAPLSGVQVLVQRMNVRGMWMDLDGFWTDDRGEFSGEIPDFGLPDPDYRLVARLDGRPDKETAPFNPADTGSLDLAMDPGGILAHDIRDTDGRSIPAKITLWQDGQVYRRIYALAEPAEVGVIPGTYSVSVTRGFEYTHHQGQVEITATAVTPLSVTLERVIDATGFLSVDAHVHAEHSPDSRVLIPERIATVAAEGLEVVVATDHEHVSDWSPGVAETGLGDWVATVMGQEVTANIPEHTNMYPVPYSDAPRGGIIYWYGMDIAEIYPAERARGAGIISLNHARWRCGYLCLIGYDRLTGLPTLQDPTLLGLSSDAVLWSWDFDTIELMNGYADPDPFHNPGSPERSGIFDDWLSFLNLGHKKTAVATTDLHFPDAPGTPRTYFVSSTDDPAAFDEADLVRSMREGRALLSSGAFARVTVDATGRIGDTITSTDATVDLAVRIDALPGVDVTHFKVFVNCDEVLNVPTDAPDARIKHNGIVQVPVAVDAHIVVAGFGTAPLPTGLVQFNPARVPRFVTNAIYVDRDGNGIYDPPGGKTCTYTIP